MTALPHHLAAVWFADVVGYTPLSEEDEGGAWRLVQVFQGCVQRSVDRFGGRVVKFLGDGALAEFPSTELAVRSACGLIGEFATAVAAAGLDAHQIRVGVHMGDVGTAPDGDLIGDGVNVASRIQAVAEPGEVWVSDDVRRQLRQRREFRFHPRGERELKGLRHPLALHTVDVTADGEALAPPPTGLAAATTAAANRDGRVRRDRRGVALLGLALGLVLAALGIWRWAGSGGERPAGAPPGWADSVSARSVGVLPFVNMSGDPDQEYFSDGLTEEILNELARVPGLKVPARTSSFAFKGRNLPVREIAGTLGVAHVLEGSVRTVGDRVRITAQLIDANNGYHLWSDSYDRELIDVFAVQTEVARAVAEALRLEIDSVDAPSTTSVEAHLLYLRGMHISQNTFSEADLLRSQEMFRQALAHDPRYPDPYVGIAWTWIGLADDWRPPREAYPRAREALEQALALDPDNDRAKETLAQVLFLYAWDLDAAERLAGGALERNPNLADATTLRGGLYALHGEAQRAVEEFARAEELDPIHPSSEFALRFLLGLRRYPEAEALARENLAVTPTLALPIRWLGDVLLATGRAEEALQVFREGLERNPGLARLENGEARALAALGRREEAQAIAARMEREAEVRYVRAEEIAGVWAALGDADRAFRWLERAVEDRSAGIPFLTLYPMYDPLRSDPRFDRLVRSVGLPDPNR